MERVILSYMSYGMIASFNFTYYISLQQNKLIFAPCYCNCFPTKETSTPAGSDDTAPVYAEQDFINPPMLAHVKSSTLKRSPGFNLTPETYAINF